CGYFRIIQNVQAGEVVFCPPIKKEQNGKFLFNLTFQTPLRSFGSAFLLYLCSGNVDYIL
ncbi:MAG: hypothetical protein WBG91_18560, partial [Syntrophobacteria bacterium]